MRRTLSLCLTILLLLFSVGCGHKEENDIFPALEEETRISIESRWWSYQYENGFRFLPNWYTELTRSGLDGVRYYGRYGYFDVWYAPTAIGTPMTREICGISFSSGNEFVIYASSYTDTGLEPLYDHGMLSREDLEGISAVHQAYEERIAGIKATWDTEVTENTDEVVLPVASEDLKGELEQAHEATFGWKPYWNEERNGGYYGTYNGCSVFFQSTTLTAETEKRVAGESFWHSTSFMLIAYRDGQWKSIEDAYDFYWLTKADVEQVARIHAKYERLEGFEWEVKDNG